jgi:hypothetical protein
MTLVVSAVLLAAPLAERSIPHAAPWLSLGSGLGLVAVAYLGLVQTLGPHRDWARNAEVDAQQASYLESKVAVGDRMVTLGRQRLTPPVSMLWSVLALLGAFRLFLTLAPWFGLVL